MTGQLSKQAKLIRGRLVCFHGEPQPGSETEALDYVGDGAMLVDGGLIVWSGEYSAMPPDFAAVETVDYRPHLISPGFIDPHLHFPQSQVVASYAGNLLEWLNNYTFIEEQRYGDPRFCTLMAQRFIDQLIAHGTTSAVAFGSVHRASADALLAAALAHNMHMAAGKVMMDRNAPEALTDTPQSGYDDTQSLIDTWHGRGRVEVAITPRFALTSTEAQMEAAGALAKANPACLIQTHLSENHDEIAAVTDLYPWAKDYTDIYEHYGLLGGTSLMGHTIHVCEREVSRLAETGAVAVFCPTSNLFLGSGLFDAGRLRLGGVRQAIATDIGGGTSWSMLRTMDEGYKVLNLQGQRWHPFHSWWQATAGNAQAIGKGGQIGTLCAGAHADFIVLDACATPAMAARMERAETVEDELFCLQTMGDDRAIAETWISGKAMKGRGAT